MESAISSMLPGRGGINLVPEGIGFCNMERICRSPSSKIFTRVAAAAAIGFLESKI
jgi:hypothetical protein